MKNFKKNTKRVLCLALALSMLTGLLMLGARQSWQGLELGALSQYYEIGSVDGKGDPGYISTVDGDSGGTSYGIYMFASNSNVPYKFAQWLRDSENKIYNGMGTKLLNAYNTPSPGYGPNFNAAWKDVAATNKEAFYQAQREYWQSKYYDGLAATLKTDYGLDVNDYGIALKNVVWSRSVQHGVGGATNVISRALETLGGFKYQSEAELISAIYAESGKLTGTDSIKMKGSLAEKYNISGQSLAYYSINSGAVQESVYRRLRVNEPHDALTMLYQNRSSAALLPDGAYIIKDNANQNRYLTADGTVSADPKVDNKMVLTWYEGGFYTITCGDKRLTGTGTGASFDAPAKNTAQHWEIVYKDGFVLKNRSTGRYLTVTQEGKLGASEKDTDAARWQILSQGDVYTRDLILPNKDNKLTVGSSSFPMRGIITSARPLDSVTVIAKTVNKTGGDRVVFQASSGKIGESFYDLWELDGQCSYSQLAAGDYVVTVNVKVSGEDNFISVASSEFTVGDKSSTLPPATETYTVTFDANGGTCSVKTKKYELGQVYGDLPVATRSDGKFLGWFTSDGAQIAPSTPVAAEDHTVTAKYGELYAATFKFDNSAKDEVRYFAEGDLITAPAAPIKASDGTYTYSFSHWADAAGNKLEPGVTCMGAADMTYTAVYTKTELPSPTDPNTPVDGGSLTGIDPKTDVSKLTSAGYTVYSGDKKITSGYLGTGMKAVANNVSVTIVVTGDASGDGKITITDVVKLQSAVVGKTDLTGAYAKAADVSGDGKITITDVVQVAQYTVGKRTFN